MTDLTPLDSSHSSDLHPLNSPHWCDLNPLDSPHLTDLNPLNSPHWCDLNPLDSPHLTDFQDLSSLSFSWPNSIWPGCLGWGPEQVRVECPEEGPAQARGQRTRRVAQSKVFYYCFKEACKRHFFLHIQYRFAFYCCETFRFCLVLIAKLNQFFTGVYKVPCNLIFFSTPVFFFIYFLPKNVSPLPLFPTR